MIIELPVRFTSDTEALHEWTTLHLEISKTAFLLVDCTFENPPESGVGEVIRQMLVPALAVVREVEMKPIFLYGGDRGAPHAIASELHGIRRGVTRQVSPWPLPAPEWVPGLAPQDGDAVIEKCGQNGFRATQLEAYLRSHGIETLLCAGFSFKSCLFYTLVGAFEHNYRVVFLRDGTHPLGENEFRDTRNEALEEKGWVRLVLTRLIEDQVGYSSTCAALIQACRALIK
ncbi:hypothetical protein C6495_05390 [Candidatus Poribacteria bacterium]|nr:MAG: hypothetical protein C6495_05390 [Candidatus Poribacteria bacterium]